MKKNKILCMILFLVLIFPIIMVEAATSVTFEDDFPGVAIDPNNWHKRIGTTGTVANSALNVTSTVLKTLYDCSQVVWSESSITFNATGFFGVNNNRVGSFGLYNGSAGTEWPDQNAAYFTMGWGHGGWGAKSEVFAKTYADGVSSSTKVCDLDENAYHNYTIVWEAERVRFYLDGVLNVTHTKTVNENFMTPFIRCYEATYGAGYHMSFGKIWIEEERDTYYDDPITVRTDYTFPGGSILDHTWFEANTSLLVRVSATGTNSSVWVWRPDRLRRYFIEVFLNGTPTTNLQFVRVNKELKILAQNLGSEHVFLIDFVDPPQWLVDLAFYLVAAFGISIMPLVKWWEKVEKINTYLPYILIFIGLICALFAAWYIWQYLIFIKTTPKLY